MSLPVLTIASGNQRKVSEISEMLGVLSLRVQKQPEYLNVEETGNTYFENALLKARAAALAFRSAFSKYVFPVSSTFKYSGCFWTLKDKTPSISEISETFLWLPLAIVRTGRLKIANKFIENIIPLQS